MEEEEIVERGLIAFSILFFSVEVMAEIILKEKEKQMMKDGLYITVKEV